MKTHSCDLCGSDDPAEIEVARQYMAGPLHVCKNCGLVYVRERRTSKEVADAWTELYQTYYSAVSPQARAQHAWLGQHMQNIIGLHSRRVLDIGGGQGHFSKLLRDEYGALSICLDPSPLNAAFSVAPAHICARIEEMSGAVKFDVITLNFTLETCADASDVMKKCWELLVDGGTLFVQTGARVMVGQGNRLLSNYLTADRPPDTHPLRFSPQTLTNFFQVHGFEPQSLQIYATELLMLVGRKSQPIAPSYTNDWKSVVKFFEDWHEDTAKLAKNIKDHGTWAERLEIHPKDGLPVGTGERQGPRAADS